MRNVSGNVWKMGVENGVGKNGSGKNGIGKNGKLKKTQNL